MIEWEMANQKEIFRDRYVLFDLRTLAPGMVVTQSVQNCWCDMVLKGLIFHPKTPACIEILDLRAMQLTGFYTSGSIPVDMLKDDAEHFRPLPCNEWSIMQVDFQNRSATETVHVIGAFLVDVIERNWKAKLLKGWEDERAELVFKLGEANARIADLNICVERQRRELRGK